MDITVSLESGTSYIKETPALVLTSCYNILKRISKGQREAGTLLKIANVLFNISVYMGHPNLLLDTKYQIYI